MTTTGSPLSSRGSSLLYQQSTSTELLTSKTAGPFGFNTLFSVPIDQSSCSQGMCVMIHNIHPSRLVRLKEWNAADF